MRTMFTLIILLLFGGVTNTCNFLGATNSALGPVVRQTPTLDSSGLSDTLTGVSFINETVGWGVSSNSLWKTSNKGVSWEKIHIFEDKSVGAIKLSVDLSGVQARSQDKVLLLHNNRLVEFDEANHEIRILFSNEKEFVRGFRFIDEDNGWVVGQSNTDSQGNWSAIAYNSNDGGKSWNPIKLDIASKCNCSFYDVLVLSDQSAFLVGDIIARTYHGGSRVEIIEAFGSLQGKISGIPVSIDSLNDNLIWIVGNQGNRFLVSDNGGKSWKSRSLDFEEQVLDVKFLDSSRVIILSANGIWESPDAGMTWQEKQKITGNPLLLYKLPKTSEYYLVGDDFTKVSL